MGYQTIKRLPRMVRTYAQARMIHDNSKPIRGRNPIVRPLGDRRDCDTYKVSMRDDGAVEFILYKTPVIRYFPDDTMEITTAGWSTVSTHQMFQWVLGIDARGMRGKTIVEVGGNKYALDGDSKIELKCEPDEFGRNILKVLDSPVMKGYRINRKASNQVKARYKEFADYLKAFTSLREVEKEQTNYGRTFTFREISYTVGEAAQLLGTYMKGDELRVAKHVWAGLDNFPLRTWNQSMENKRVFDETAQRFFALCRSDQPEETKHHSFHKAAMVLLTYADRTALDADEASLTNIRIVRFNGDNVSLESVFMHILRKHHRKEILEAVDMKEGVAPNAMYQVWMYQVWMDGEE